MRIEEWLDSSAAAFDWPDVGRAAWRRWKDQRDRPPTPHQFSEVCRAVLQAQRLDRPRLTEAALTDEQVRQNLRMIRATREAFKGAKL
jgi:predicted dehydrogenase